LKSSKSLKLASKTTSTEFHIKKQSKLIPFFPFTPTAKQCTALQPQHQELHKISILSLKKTTDTKAKFQTTKHNTLILYIPINEITQLPKCKSGELETIQIEMKDKRTIINIRN
jgi:hypothetical protein